MQIKHVDADLANPQESVVWKTLCRYCGTERGSGLASMVTLVGVLAVAGGFLCWLVSPVLGALVLSGVAMGSGWIARIAWLGRVSSFGFRSRD